MGYKPPEFTYLNLLKQGFLQINLVDVLFEENSDKAACYNCPHLYENYCDILKNEWKADDRAEDAALWRVERRLLHAAPLKWGRWGSQFDPVAKDQFFTQRQLFYVEGTGVSGLTFTRVAKIRIAGTRKRLFVEIPRTKGLSKNAKRKLVRYGHKRLLNAVKEYWDNK
jgi:hypothetical protein